MNYMVNMKNYKNKEHNKITKFVKKVNKTIMTDSYLGYNRFEIKEKRFNFHPYEDKSGGHINIVYEIKDNWTNNFAHFAVNQYNYKREIFEFTNDFLILCSSDHHGNCPAPHYYNLCINKIASYAPFKENSNFSMPKTVSFTWVPSLISNTNTTKNLVQYKTYKLFNRH